MSKTDVLAAICADKAVHVKEQKAIAPLRSLEGSLGDIEPPRGFIDALRHKHARLQPALIAEIKKASPSKGLIRSDFAPDAIARAYASAGAACLSVLTDVPYFQGADEYIAAVRRTVDLPVLRKDFMIDPYQVVESRAIGADCILIIMAAVDDALARELMSEAGRLGMDALVEVHDGVELDRAVDLGAPMIGINNRSLRTLTVDLATTEELYSRLPVGTLIVSESGFYTGGDLLRMRALGISTFLIGESLMRQPDIAAATKALLDCWDAR